MKKVIAVLSILMLLVGSLTGCKKEKNYEAEFYGSWEAEIDLSAYLKERIISNNDKLKDTLKLTSYPATVTLTFSEDGRLTRTIDGAFDEETMDTMRAELKAGYTAYYTQYLRESGLEMTITEFEKATGVSLDRKVEQVADVDYLNGLVDEIEFNGTFRAEEQFVFLGGYISGSLEIGHAYTMEDGKLTLSISTEPSGFEKAFYPLTFVAVQE